VWLPIQLIDRQFADGVVRDPGVALRLGDRGGAQLPLNQLEAAPHRGEVRGECVAFIPRAG